MDVVPLKRVRDDSEDQHELTVDSRKRRTLTIRTPSFSASTTVAPLESRCLTESSMMQPDPRSGKAPFSASETGVPMIRRVDLPTPSKTPEENINHQYDVGDVEMLDQASSPAQPHKSLQRTSIGLAEGVYDTTLTEDSPSRSINHSTNLQHDLSTATSAGIDMGERKREKQEGFVIERKGKVMMGFRSSCPRCQAREAGHYMHFL